MHECNECTYVANSQSIVYTRQQREKAQKNTIIFSESSIVKLGRFTMPNWVGHATFYLFQCPFCDSLSVDYVHGYAYLTCQNCRENWVVKGDRFYTNDGRQPEPSLLQQIFGLSKFLIKNRKLIRFKASSLDSCPETPK